MVKPNPEWSAEAQRSNCSLRQLFRRAAGQVSGPPGLWLYAGVHPGNGLECVPRGIAKSEMGGWTIGEFCERGCLEETPSACFDGFSGNSADYGLCADRCRRVSVS